MVLGEGSMGQCSIHEEGVGADRVAVPVMIGASPHLPLFVILAAEGGRFR